MVEYHVNKRCAIELRPEKKNKKLSKPKKKNPVYEIFYAGDGCDIFVKFKSKIHGHI